MKTYNNVTLLGNVAKNPETKVTEGGLTICTFTIVTNSTWKDKNSGEWTEKPVYHRCKAMAKLGERADEYLAKSMSVFLVGKLDTHTWEEEGKKRYLTEVIVTDFQMLGSKADGDRARRQTEEPEGDVPF